MCYHIILKSPCSLLCWSVIHAFWIIFPIGFVDFLKLFDRFMVASVDVLKVGHAIIFSLHRINIFMIYCSM